MSEYTTIYLRCKEIPLLKYKEHPSYEEYQKLSKEDLMKVNLTNKSPSLWDVNCFILALLQAES